MSKLATAIIIAVLLSAGIVMAQEQLGGMPPAEEAYEAAPKLPDITIVTATYDPKTGYKYYTSTKTETIELGKADVELLKKSDPEEMRAIEMYAEETALPPEKAFESRNYPAELKEQAQTAAAQAETSAKEPEGPVLTTYPGIPGQFYEIAPMEEAAGTAISITYDSSGNLHFIEMPAAGNAREITVGDALEKTHLDAESFQKAYGQRIEDKKAELPWVQRTMGSAVWLFRQYNGMAGWSSLIFDEKFLTDWKDKVNKLMCEYTGGLLGGKECITSKICGRYSDIEPSRDGILYASPVGGVPDAIAHVEGQRSMPFLTPNATMWVYTVTFGLSNPSEEEGMTYNIAFNGPTASARWWPEPQYLPEKGSVSATGAAALMKLSPNDYTEACIEFDPGIETFDGRRKGSICNGIAQYSGEATAPYTAETANASATTLPQPGSQPAGAPGANV